MFSCRVTVKTLLFPNALDISFISASTFYISNHKKNFRTSKRHLFPGSVMSVPLFFFFSLLRNLKLLMSARLPCTCLWKGSPSLHFPNKLLKHFSLIHEPCSICKDYSNGRILYSWKKKSWWFWDSILQSFAFINVCPYIVDKNRTLEYIH